MQLQTLGEWGLYSWGAPVCGSPAELDNLYLLLLFAGQRPSGEVNANGAASIENKLNATVAVSHGCSMSASPAVAQNDQKTLENAQKLMRFPMVSEFLMN